MKALLFAVLMLQAVPVFADLDLIDGWARATPPGMPMGAIYASLINTGDADVEVVEISTPVARAAEIHQSVEVDGLMRMREIKPFILKAGEATFLQPGGKHVMLMGLHEGLKQGQKFPLRLRLSDETVVSVMIVTGGFGQMSMPDR